MRIFQNRASATLGFLVAAIIVVPRAGASALIDFVPAASCSVGYAGNGSAISSGGCVMSSLDAPFNGVTGVELEGAATGGAMVVTSNGGIFGLYLNERGGTVGSDFNGTIPVLWNFTVSSSTGANLSWGVTVRFSGNLSTVTATAGDPNSFTTVSGSTVSGETLFNGAALPGSSITGYQILLQVNQADSVAGNTITVTAPYGGVEINPAPEPETLALVCAGVAGLVLRRTFMRLPRY